MKKTFLRVSKKCNEEKCRKNYSVLFYLRTSSLIDSLILPFFLLFLFFCFYEFIFPSFSFPTFLRFFSYRALSLFYAFILRFHHLKSYEARECAQWSTCYVGRRRKNSCPCYKLISPGKWTRTGDIRENISEVGRPNWDSKTVFLICRIYVNLLHLHVSRKNYA
jgi:hypothetical protein